MTCPVCAAPGEGSAEWCSACGADLVPLAPGSVVAQRYEVRALLGRGGMGLVYRAFDRVLQDTVALKVQRAGDEAAERRFRNEVKLARRASHPAVCRLHDGGHEGGRRFISMELVEGETLAARVARGALPAEEAWPLAIQAAEGLAAVHRAGIVHRDLKPPNFMVDGSGRLRLMDFGIARTTASRDTQALAYALGSPEYMSPEQARGRPADARSDVYAMGVVLYELFTGRVPFRADTPVATLLLHLEAVPAFGGVLAALRPVLERALAKEPARRYADGAALAVALRAASVASGLPEAKGAARRRGPRAAAAILSLVIVAAVAWGTFNSRQGLKASRNPGGHASPSASFAVPARRIAPSPVAPSLAASAAPALGDAVAPAAAPVVRSHPAAPSLRSTATPSTTLAAHPVAPPAGTPTPVPPPPLASSSSSPNTVGVLSSSPPQAREEGALLVVVQPWADVSVDGVPRGQTPLGRLALSAGPHAVLLTHPDYQPYPRRVTIRPGETLRLALDLRTDGVRRRP